MVKAEGGGRIQAVKSVTVPGKCSAISDGDWTVFPLKYRTQLIYRIPSTSIGFGVTYLRIYSTIQL
jgi:hypothetical protein